MIVALWGPVWVEPILPMKHAWPTGDLGRGRFHPKPFLYRYWTPLGSSAIAVGLGWLLAEEPPFTDFGSETIGGDRYN